LLFFNLKDDKLDIIDNMMTNTMFKVVHEDCLEKLVSFNNYSVQILKNFVQSKVLIHYLEA